MAFSPSGALYFADSANHRIRSISPAGQISSVAGTGTAAFNGDGGPAGSAALNNPQAVAFDASGALYIADSGNGRIRKVDADGTITTIAGNGLSGGASDLARSTSLGTLLGLAVAPNGDIYASDGRAHQVVRITPDGLLQVVAGTAVAGFGGDGGAGWAAMTFSPAGLVLDPAGNLVVFDSRNDRIRAINAK
jgi:sugar lactone lactonase YvrE